jgi:hypothetical protein
VEKRLKELGREKEAQALRKRVKKELDRAKEEVRRKKQARLTHPMGDVD